MLIFSERTTEQCLRYSAKVTSCLASLVLFVSVNVVAEIRHDDYLTKEERRNLNTAYDINVIMGFFAPRPGSEIRQGSAEAGVDWEAAYAFMAEDMILVQTGNSPLESRAGDGIFRGTSGYREAVESWVEGFDGDLQLRYLAASADTVTKLLQVTFSDDSRRLDWFEVWRFDERGKVSVINVNYVNPELANAIFNERRVR